MHDAGLDVATADLTIGTSAGSTAAVQIAGASPTDLLADVLGAAPQPRTTPAAHGAGQTSPVADHLKRMTTVISSSEDAADMRSRMGAAALAMNAASDGSWQAQWRTVVASRLPNPRWPQRRVLITAVDAKTGEPMVFHRRSGVDLVDAVAASCSSGLPYRIGDSYFIDGGYRSNAENADLAAGYGRVLVLSPFGGKSWHPLEWGTHLETQVEQLRAGGSSVEVIVPSGDSAYLFGANAMDVSLRPAAARAGYDLGKALAGQLAVFWR